MTTETASEDDNFGTEHSQKVIIKTLGMERRNKVLAGLYMGRSDVALMVRQASLHVWKVVVSNTPKTLREILPTLFNLLLSCLASNSYDKRQVAARTLGDLVKKLGERVLPEIIPILEEGLSSPQPEKRQGVCVGLSEIMMSTSKDMVMSFVDSLVPTVRRALVDDLPEVRQAAAKTFDSLYNTVGARALEDILPHLLAHLGEDEALDGLRQVMAIRAKAVLPYLVPQLIAPPTVNMRALACIGPVAGDALNRHLGKILPAVIGAVAGAAGAGGYPETLAYAEAVVLSVGGGGGGDEDGDDVGLGYIMDELMTGCSSSSGVEIGNNRKGSTNYQVASVTLLHVFCRDTKLDYSQYVPQLIRSLILLFTSDNESVLQEAWHALAAVIKTLDTNELMAHVGDVRQALRFASGDMREKQHRQEADPADSAVTLPGFCLPKGIQPVLPIFREALLNGGPELKEQAAVGLGELIGASDAEALKPSVVHITGPLIRILGDRFAANVKTAVLDTLAGLLKKASVLLKPFFPQLQTTFMKALNDPNRTVRLRAGLALSHLIAIHVRPDPLFNELSNGIKASSSTTPGGPSIPGSSGGPLAGGGGALTSGDDASQLRDTYLQALRGCLLPAGDKMSAPIRRQILPQLLALLAHSEDSGRCAAAGCLGTFLKHLPDEDVDQVVNDHLLSEQLGPGDWILRHGRAVALFVGLKVAPDRISVPDQPDREDKVVGTIRSQLAADRVPIVQSAVRSCCYLFSQRLKAGRPLPADLVQPFAKMMNHSSNDVKQLVGAVSVYLAKEAASLGGGGGDGEGLLPPELLKPLLPMLVNGTKEKNPTVKSSSESALVAVLKLRQRSSAQQDSVKDGGGSVNACLSLLESGSREALQDVITKVLQRVAQQPEGKEMPIDDTQLI